MEKEHIHEQFLSSSWCVACSCSLISEYHVYMPKFTSIYLKEEQMPRVKRKKMNSYLREAQWENSKEGFYKDILDDLLIMNNE